MGIVDVVVSALEVLADDFVDFGLDEDSDVVEDDLFLFGHGCSWVEKESFIFILLIFFVY